MKSLNGASLALKTRRAALKRKRSYGAMEVDQDVSTQSNRPKKHKSSAYGSQFFITTPLDARFVIRPPHAEDTHSLISASKPLIDSLTTQNLDLDDKMGCVSRATCHTINATRQSDWWLTSGDIVLGVESLIFKVHKKVLAEHSSVFEGMFTLSAPSEGDCIEDIPFVQLYDSAGDWIEVLKWIYMGPPNDAFDLTQPAIFQTIRSYSNIASKYDMPALMEFAQEAFVKLYSPNLLNLLENDILRRVATSHAVESINLSRRCDMPSILPVAFFLLATAEDAALLLGETSASCQLQLADALRLQAGRQACEVAANTFLTSLLFQNSFETSKTELRLPSIECCSTSQSLKQLCETAFLTSSGAAAFARVLILLANQRTAMKVCGKCALEVEIWFVKYLDGLSLHLCRWFELD